MKPNPSLRTHKHLFPLTSHPMYKDHFYARLQARKCTDKATVAIYIVLRYRGQKALYSTRVKCKRKEFNISKQSLSNQILNTQVQSKLGEVVNAYNLFVLQGKDFTLDDIICRINQKGVRYTFTRLVDDYFEHKKKKIKASSMKTEKSGLTSFIKKLGLGSKCASEIAEGSFDRKVHNVSDQYAKTTLKQMLNLLQSACEFAVKSKKIEKNPIPKIDVSAYYRGVQPKEKVIPDIKAVIANSDAEGSLFADAAAFQSYTALSYIDVTKVTSANFYHYGDKLFLVGNRCKTSQPFLIPIPAYVKDLYERNGGFAALPYKKYYDYTKDRYGVGTHALRHAKARQLLNKGLPLEALARVLGHASTQMTIRYAPIHNRSFTEKELEVF